MSIWTSKRWFLCLLLVRPALSGCVLPTGGAGLSPVVKLGGDVVVAPPPGYCVDPTTRNDSPSGGLVLIGRCAGANQPAAAVLSVAAAGPGSGADLDAADGPELAAFFASRPGRAILSRSGKAETVQVQEATGRGDAFLLRLSDSSPQDRTGMQAESWRAVLGLAGRMVTLTVTGPRTSPLDDATGHALLEAFVKRMQSANRAGALGGGL